MTPWRTQSKFAPITTRSRYFSSAARKAGSPSFGGLKTISKITTRAPAAKSRSSMIAQTSRDHGNGRSVINSNARFPGISSGPTGSHFHRTLVDPEENQILPRWSCSGLPGGARPRTPVRPTTGRRGTESREAVPEEDQSRPENADRRENQEAMPTEPMHGDILWNRARSKKENLTADSRRPARATPQRVVIPSPRRRRGIP